MDEKEKAFEDLDKSGFGVRYVCNNNMIWVTDIFQYEYQFTEQKMLLRYCTYISNKKINEIVERYWSKKSDKFIIFSSYLVNMKMPNKLKYTNDKKIDIEDMDNIDIKELTSKIFKVGDKTIDYIDNYPLK